MRVNAASLHIRAATTSTPGTLNDFNNGPDHGKQQQLISSSEDIPYVL